MERLRILILPNDFPGRSTASSVSGRLDVQRVDLVIVDHMADCQRLADLSLSGVLLDLDRSGSREDLRTLRTEFPDLPIIAITSSNALNMGAAAVQAGADDYLWIEELSADRLERSIRLAAARREGGRERVVSPTLTGPEREREQLLSILDALPAYVFLQARDFTIPFWNRRFQEVFGDPTGRSCHEVFYGRIAPCSPCLTQRVFHTFETETSGFSRADGKIYAVSDRFLPGLGDEDFVVEVGIDVTERKRVEEKLERQLGVNESLADLGRRLAEPDVEIESMAQLALQCALHLTDSVDGYVTERDSITGCDRLHAQAGTFNAESACLREPGSVLFGCWRRSVHASVPTSLDASTLPSGEEKDALDRMGVRSLLSIPALLGGVSVGHIVVAGASHEYTGDDIDALQRLADLLALGIHRAQTETALRESEATQRGILQASPVGIALIEDGCFRWMNERFCGMTGFSEEELLKRSLKRIFASDSEYARFQHMGTGRAFSESQSEMELEWRRRNGERLDIAAGVSALETDIPRKGFILAVRDITGRREAERFSNLTQYSINTAPACVFWMRTDGRIIFANDAACRILGYENAELLSRRLDDLCYCPIHGESGVDWERILQGNAGPIEAVLTREDGMRIPVEGVAHVLEFEGERCVFAFLQDASPRRRLERERKELAAQLQQSQRLESIGTLASGIAHEVNNPLMAMMNYAELIGERVDDDVLLGYAQSIQGAGRRVAQAIRSLLSFTRVDLEPHRSERLGESVSGAVSLMGEVFRRDQIDLQIDVPDDLPALRYRSRQIEQVIINLLANARDALNARFPEAHEEKRIEVSAYPLAHSEPGWQRLTIEDRGVGICEEDLPRICDPFFTTKPLGQGTGLGLSISYGIISDHGGRMKIESAVGDFTRIHIDLPPEVDPSLI